MSHQLTLDNVKYILDYSSGKDCCKCDLFSDSKDLCRGSNAAQTICTSHCGVWRKGAVHVHGMIVVPKNVNGSMCCDECDMFDLCDRRIPMPETIREVCREGNIWKEVI